MYTLTYGTTLTKCVLPGDQVASLMAALRLRNPDYDPDLDKMDEDGEPLPGDVNPEYVEFYDEDTRSIPTGLVPYVMQWAKDRGLDVELVGFPSTLPFPPKVSADLIPGITLRPYQVNAIAVALQRQRGIIEIATGGGKSEIAIGITMSLGTPRTLYIVPDQAAMYQTYERFIQRGFREGVDVGRLGDTLYEIDKPILIAVINSVYSAIKRRDERVLEVLENAELFFADEVHHQGTAVSWQVVALQCSAPYRYGLSGTPYKNDSSRFNPHFLHPHDSWLTGLIGDTLVYVSAAQLQEQGDLTPVEVVSFPAGGEVLEDTATFNAAQRRAKWNRQYKEGVIENEVRNSRIVCLAENLTHLGRAPIISVKSLSHGRTLQRLLAKRNISTICSYGSKVTILPRVLCEELKWDYQEVEVWSVQMTPKLKKENKRTLVQIEVLEMDIADNPTATKKKKLATLKRKLKKGPQRVGFEAEFVQALNRVDVEWLVSEGYIEVLIGNVIYDEARDMPVLTDLINAAGGKAQQRYRQKVGRVLRLASGKDLARVWDPYDTCCPTLFKHTMERLTTAAAQGFPVISNSEFARALCTLQLDALKLGEIKVKNTELEVTIDLTIPVGGPNSFKFIKPRVTLRAELEDGDDLDVCTKKLSTECKAVFIQEALRQSTIMSDILKVGFTSATEYLSYFKNMAD